MIKIGDKIKVKESSDVVILGWIKKGEEVNVVDVIQVRGKERKLYLVENEAETRVGIYIEDVEGY